MPSRPVVLFRFHFVPKGFVLRANDENGATTGTRFEGELLLVFSAPI